MGVFVYRFIGYFPVTDLSPSLPDFSYGKSESGFNSHSGLGINKLIFALNWYYRWVTQLFLVYMVFIFELCRFYIKFI